MLRYQLRHCPAASGQGRLGLRARADRWGCAGEVEGMRARPSRGEASVVAAQFSEVAASKFGAWKGFVAGGCGPIAGGGSTGSGAENSEVVSMGILPCRLRMPGGPS